jgi:hypothetical protein
LLWLTARAATKRDVKRIMIANCFIFLKFAIFADYEIKQTQLHDVVVLIIKIFLIASIVSNNDSYCMSYACTAPCIQDHRVSSTSK